MPNTAFLLAPLYRSPICVAGGGPDEGKVVSFKYWPAAFSTARRQRPAIKLAPLGL